MSKTWPDDAVMVVASLAGEERREVMEDPQEAVCRDCGRAVCYDTATVTRARASADIKFGGRPVDFFCTECAVTYDRGSIDVLQDHRA